jgi:hypothetical protein
MEAQFTHVPSDNNLTEVAFPLKLHRSLITLAAFLVIKKGINQ